MTSHKMPNEAPDSVSDSDEPFAAPATSDGLENRTVRESFHESSHTKLDTLAQETPIAFAYNGHSHAVMMATPVDLEDYALGFSLTERIIDAPEELLNTEIRSTKMGIAINAHIPSSHVQRLDQQRRQLSGRSSCGICGITDLAAAIPTLPPLSSGKPPSHRIIHKAISQFHDAQRLQQRCGAVHCAALFNPQGTLLMLREDIGRHNALDKLIGAIKQAPCTAHSTISSTISSTICSTTDTHHTNVDEHFVLLSSRASHELIIKTAIAGIKTLVTLSAATTLAVDIAQQLNINLIGFIRGERQIIYAP